MNTKYNGRLDTKKYYPIFKTNSAELDGKVFVGISSTKIYCRPICHSKAAKEENCTYFKSAAAAEAAGYRPCMVCRPELVLGHVFDSSSDNIAKKAASILEENCAHDYDIGEIAENLNITNSELIDSFGQTYGATPEQYLQTHRLLTAKRLLTDTDMTDENIALEVGMSSTKHLSEMLEKYYRKPLSSFRKRKKTKIHNRKRSGNMKNDFLQYTAIYNSPLGPLTIASDGESITGLWMENSRYYGETLGEHEENSDFPVFDQAFRWLDAYFNGENPEINLPLNTKGSEFAKSVWDILLKIPYCGVTTYGNIASQIAKKTGKNSMSAQAVGGAVGHNPISIIIPCHRVVGSNGSLTGFGGGIANKIKLLELEKADMSKFFIPKKGTAL